MPASPAGRPKQRPPRRPRPAVARRPGWARQPGPAPTRPPNPAPTRPPRDWIAITAAGLPGLAALIALIFASLAVTATNDQLQIAQQGQITDRYNAAITNLGSHSIEIRLGGIYALQRLMQDSPRDQSTVIAVLCAFVRDQSPSPAKPLTLNAELSYRQPTDIQAALTVVGTRDTSHDTRTTVIDLNGTLLINAELQFLHLSRANLSGAIFLGADLSGADLSGAGLSGVELRGADLSGAHFGDTNLSGAFLIGADLSHADLGFADLRGADLGHADLRGADLRLVNLRATFFGGANLTGARWRALAAVPEGWLRNPRTGRLTRAP